MYLVGSGFRVKRDSHHGVFSLQYVMMITHTFHIWFCCTILDIWPMSVDRRRPRPDGHERRASLSEGVPILRKYIPHVVSNDRGIISYDNRILRNSAEPNLQCSAVNRVRGIGYAGRAGQRIVGGYALMSEIGDQGDEFLFCLSSVSNWTAFPTKPPQSWITN